MTRKNVLLDVFESEFGLKNLRGDDDGKGVLIIDAPTGLGKSYASREACKSLLQRLDEAHLANKRVFLIAPQIKQLNLPDMEKLTRYEDSSLKDSVLILRL